MAGHPRSSLHRKHGLEDPLLFLKARANGDASATPCMPRAPGPRMMHGRSSVSSPPRPQLPSHLRNEETARWPARHGEDRASQPRHRPSLTSTAHSSGDPPMKGLTPPSPPHLRAAESLDGLLRGIRSSLSRMVCLRYSTHRLLPRNIKAWHRHLPARAVQPFDD